MDLHQFEIQILPFKDKIFRLALFLLSDKAEAEDATQEVFVRLWNHKNNLSSVENIQAFVLRVTRNLCLDKLRTLNRRQEEVDSSNNVVEETMVNPHEQTEQRNLLDFVKQQIKLLPEMQRTIITLRDIEELEFDEIAQITGLNENAIKVNLSRARKKIRDYFSSER
ncbi:MAG: RNA polymerase sigma factor [Paludibacteraceae bacterium]|nr:RNA polymerase sigma factor [Paludibacteraceae bacterium]